MSTRTINELDGEPNDREDEEPPADDTVPHADIEASPPVAAGGSGKDKNYGAGNVLTRAAAMLQGMRDRGELSGDETSPAAETGEVAGGAEEGRFEWNEDNKHKVALGGEWHDSLLRWEASLSPSDKAKLDKRARELQWEYFKVAAEVFLNDKYAEEKGEIKETLRLNEAQLKTFKERLYKRIMEQIKTNEREETQKSFFTIANESMNDISAIEEHLNDFLEYSREKLELSKPVSIKFISDQENAQNTLGKTAFYDPGLNEISLYVDNRHPKDVMRSLSHEMVHHAQNGRGQFEGTMVVGEQGYAQNDTHLREMEREAYECGNMIFRDWEDGVKQQVPLAEWRRDELSNRLMERMGLKPKEVDINSFRCIVESNSDNDDESTNIEENCGCQDPTHDHGPPPEGEIALPGAEGKEDIEGLAAAAMAAVHQLAAASGADVSTTVETGDDASSEEDPVTDAALPVSTGPKQSDLEWYYEQLNKRMMGKI